MAAFVRAAPDPPDLLGGLNGDRERRSIDQYGQLKDPHTTPTWETCDETKWSVVCTFKDDTVV